MKEVDKNKQPIMIRNDKFFDGWSVIHLITSILFTLIIGPKITLVIVFLWEPLEIFLLSPLLSRMGINFGEETLKNSISDLIFDAVGVAIGIAILKYTLVQQLIVL